MEGLKYQFYVYHAPPGRLNGCEMGNFVRVQIDQMWSFNSWVEIYFLPKQVVE